MTNRLHYRNNVLNSFTTQKYDVPTFLTFEHYVKNLSPLN